MGRMWLRWRPVPMAQSNRPRSVKRITSRGEGADELYLADGGVDVH